MSLLNRLKTVAPFKDFSPATFILFLICLAGILLFMIASVAATGFLGAFNHIIETYHTQTVQSSDAFIISGLERLIKSTVKHVQKQWKNSPITNSDFSQARYNLTAWHWDFTSRALSLVSNSGTTRVLQTEAPFRPAVEMNISGNNLREGISLPSLPSGINWQITRQTYGNHSAWLMWGVAENADSGIWGFRLRQEDLRPQLVKLLRRVCHDNHMQVALLDRTGKMFIAADYRGELENISSLAPQKNQEFFTRELGSIWPDMKMQVVFTPGIFGQLNDWIIKAMLGWLFMMGVTLIGGVYGIYEMGRQSTKQLRLQNDWVLNLAHSLRGPCHSLGVLLEAIKRNKTSGNEELFQLSQREIEVMDTHCRQFLQLARADSKDYHGRVETVMLADCLNRAVERIVIRYPQFSRELVTFKGGHDIKISVYPLALEESIMTIIDNAVKYSRATKQVRIEGKIVDCSCMLSVEDSGAGIAPEDMPLIGQPFYRSSRPDIEGIAGTGIGLYLVKEACRVMSWPLSIESEGRDKGTRVTLKIPMEQKCKDS
jgi:signal transduction histidine kinase